MIRCLLLALLAVVFAGCATSVARPDSMVWRAADTAPLRYRERVHPDGVERCHIRSRGQWYECYLVSRRERASIEEARIPIGFAYAPGNEN